MSLASCNNSGNNDSYELKSINIYREKSKPSKTMPIRFYSKTPNVPYVGIKEFFKEFFNTELKSVDNNGYSIFSKGDKDYIKIDSNNSILGIKGLFELGHHPDFKENTDKTFLHLDSTKTTTPQYKMIDLNKYEIKTYSNNNDVYVPFGLLNNLYGGIEGYNVAYNGTDIYVLDHYGELNNGEERGEEYFSDTYYNDLAADKDRYQDFAKYTYNQLCFSFDNLRGYTTQLVFGDNNLVSLGLNSLLETYYPSIKNLLLSTKKVDYHKGLLLLFAGLYDGGHTGLISKEPPSFKYLNELKTINEYKPLIEKVLGFDQANVDRYKGFYDTKAVAFKDYYDSSVAKYKYNNEYKTAYISFDKFVIDTKLWDQYYKGDKSKLQQLEDGSELKDTYAFVRKSLYQAKADGAKNVVIDLTTNGGGSNSAMLGVFGLLNAAKAEDYHNNTVDSTRETKYYSVDINLDGKYDELDVEEAKSFNFNIVALTSLNSFSCGNLLPSLMKEKGYKILGEKSRGGSCSVSKEQTADGFIYNRSSYYCLCNSSGGNIDSGVEVDLNLVEITNGTRNVSKFFDYKTICEYINSLKK